MKVTIHGIESVDYTSRRSGEKVEGTSLHCTCKDPNVFGESVQKIFISGKLGLASVIRDLAPGDTAEVEFNQRGYVVGLSKES